MKLGKVTGKVTVERSTESHYVAFAAEESRLNRGEIIKMDEFIQKL